MQCLEDFKDRKIAKEYYSESIKYLSNLVCATFRRIELSGYLVAVTNYVPTNDIKIIVDVLKVFRNNNSTSIRENIS